MPKKAQLTFRTVRTVDAIKAPPSGRVDHWDEETPGFGLRVAASGRKTWILFYRVRGDRRLRRATLGTYPPLSLASAREMAREDMRAAAKGEDAAAQRKTERAADTFGELAEAYIEKHAKRKKRSWFKDRQALDRDILPRFRNRKAASMRRREVIDLLEEIAQRGAPIGANRTLEILRRIFNWGIEREIVTVNPCTKIAKLGTERQRERVLNDDEIRAVWAALDGETPLMAAMFKLRFLTAQRGGEVSRMRWQDADRDGGWWLLPGEFTKNGRAHRVPLSAPALEIIGALEPLSGKSEWIFPSPTGKGPLHVIWRAIKGIRERAKVDFVPHDIRRTIATRLAGDLGVSRLTVSKLLNHVDRGVTATYERSLYDSEKRAALDAWAARLEEIVTGKSARPRNVVALPARSA
ncbi:MAG: tyrosine-type recombinase/integrase [Alphaproteobacteria bacterium]